MLTLIGDILNIVMLAASPLVFAPLLFLATGSRAMGEFISKIASLADTLNRRVAAGTVWLALAMALVQFVIVILRYIFGVSLISMQESMIYMHGALFLLGAGYTLLNDDQVRVDIFYRESPPQRKALVDLAGTYLFLAPVCTLAIWMAGPYVAASWAVREGSNEASGVQAIFLLKSLIPIFAILLLVQGTAIAARAARTLRPMPSAAG